MKNAITEDELKAALRKRVLAGDFFLVTGGDGRGVIVEKVLDLMVDYLPSPLDVDAIWGKNPKTGDEVSRKPDEEEPMAALAFKIATDPFVGKLIFVRVYSGTLKAGSYVLNTTTGEKERVGRIVRMHADKREEIDKVGAGDIAAVVGLKSTFTGHTLCDVATSNCTREHYIPRTASMLLLLSQRQKPTKKKWVLPCSALLKKTQLSVFIPTKKLAKRSCLEWVSFTSIFLIDRMKREFNVEANIGEPQVAFRETIKGTSSGPR